MSEPKPKPTTSRWYPHPTESGGHDQWNIHRQILDLTYSNQDRLDAMEKAQGSKPTESTPAAFPNQSNDSKLAGLNVSGNTPTNGQRLTYNSTTGMIEWQ